ncbi:cytochrome P450 1A2 [Lingula anatina]|uniref:unspecific monooxygenase n=1 Tax=Lingula anatina TaxID=7574 RepID=A0A1S3JE83_LINAN|nr:cytochrome P450 1A2 [Lingula anatina]|eukprot:XP_013408725.1 cytochrome P450 1A2 [Lingula anatina]
MAAKDSFTDGCVQAGGALLHFFMVFTCVFIGVSLAKFFLDHFPKSDRNKDRRTQRRLPPGPRGWPILGHLPYLGSHPHQVLARWRENYGDIYRIRMGSKTVVVVNGLAATRHVLLDRRGEFDGRASLLSFSSICDGASLTNNRDYGVSDVQRKIAVRALNAVMKDKQNLEELISKQADNLVKNILKNEERPYDPASDFLTAVSSVIFALVFGCGRAGNLDEQFMNMLKSVRNFTDFCKAGNPADFFPWLEPFMRERMRKFKAMADMLPRICHRLLQERWLTSYTPTLSHITPPRDVMDVLINYVTTSSDARRTKKLADAHVFNLLSDIVGAGFHTTSTALNWVTLCLVAFQDAQRKAQIEIDSVIGKSREPRTDDMDKTPYVMAMIHEVLRFRPVLPLSLPRATTREVVLGEFYIPDDTMVLINYWSVCHDSSVWTDPDLFKPERFLRTDAAGRTTIDNELKERATTFSVGKRKCLGYALALKELFIMVTALLQKTYILPEEGEDYEEALKGEFGLAMTPKPYKVRFCQRSSL